MVMDNQHSVLTDISTAYALSLQQRIQHPETTPEERERLQAELNALLAQWSANLEAAFEAFAKPLWEHVQRVVKMLADWVARWFKRPRPRFPVTDKRAWQHAQKRRAQVRRQRRAQKRALATLRMQYQPRRRAHYV